jgi:hypothetical protein
MARIAPAAVRRLFLESVMNTAHYIGLGPADAGGTSLAPLSGMRFFAPILTLTLSATGCAAPVGSPADGDDAVLAGKADGEGVRYQPWDAPVLLEESQTFRASLRYEQHRLETEGDEIHYSTQPKTTEVAWLVVPQDVVSEAMDQGDEIMTFHLGIESEENDSNLARMTAHAAPLEGGSVYDNVSEQTKLFTKDRILDSSEPEWVVLERGMDYHILISRGNPILHGQWGYGELDFRIRVELE